MNAHSLWAIYHAPIFMSRRCCKMHILFIAKSIEMFMGMGPGGYFAELSEFCSSKRPSGCCKTERSFAYF